MFRTNRRWLAWLFTTCLPICSAALSLYLKTLGSGRIWTWPTLVIFGSLTVLSACIAYLSLIAPVRDVHAATNLVLHSYAEQILVRAKRDKLNARLNVLLLCRPASKLFSRQFKVAWHKGMNNHPDVAVRFCCRKGVSGHVLVTKEPILANMEVPHATNWGFSEKEAAQFPRLTAIYSWPIYELNKANVQTGRIVGVVNLDTLAPGAWQKLDAKHAKYDKLLEGFCEIVSTICS